VGVMKKYLGLLGIVISLFMGLNVKAIEPINMPSNMVINPYYEAYEKLSDEEKSKISIIPNKYV
jgi:hypothetical protein